MGSYRKCEVCSRVLTLSEYEGESRSCRQCHGKPPASTLRRRRGSSKESVQAYRERTGNAYGKAYAKARAAAVRELIAMHPDDFTLLLDAARREVGLGPTRSS